MNSQFSLLISRMSPEQRLAISLSTLDMMSKTAETKLLASNIPFSQFYTHQSETGQSSWKKPEEFCSRFSLLFGAHVEEFTKSLPSFTTLKVLELGAGYLTDGRSRLSCFLPEADITYTDSSLEVVADAQERFPEIKYYSINSSNLGERIERESIDLIIGSCFLDNLLEDDLEKTLSEIHSILKPGGLFFHIQDLPPYFNTLVISHKDHPGIMFPCVDDASTFINGVQFIPLEICEEYIRMNPTTGESHFLSSYIQLSNDVRAAASIEICLLPLLAQSVSSWVKKTLYLESESSPCRKILSIDDFKERLERKLRETPFKDITSKMKVQTGYLTPEEVPTETQFNDIISSPSLFQQRKVPRENQEVRITLLAHCLVARREE